MRLVLNESEALTLRMPVEYFIILFLAVWFLFFYNLKKQTTFLTENVLDALFKNHELNNKKDMFTAVCCYFLDPVKWLRLFSPIVYFLV